MVVVAVVVVVVVVAVVIYCAALHYDQYDCHWNINPTSHCQLQAQK